mgnify:CR=1 FL=1
MQSELSQPSSAKGAYLSQYKNDISLRHKLMRERIGAGISRESNANGEQTRPDRDNIPPIDDETAEQFVPDQRNRSQYSYFDDEAEASLQFFKRNLMPKSSVKSNKTTNSPGHELTKPQTRTEYSTTRVTSSPSIKSSQDGIPLVDSKAAPASSRPAPFSVKPVPFKQTSLASPKGTEQSTHSKDVPDTYKRGSHAPQSSSSRTSLERFASETIDPKRSSLDEQRWASKSRGSTALTATDSNHNFSRDDKYDSRPSDSPSQGESTFSRKPLYNSLLRAHDSIRLKVNRPKVRPKSDVPLDDTLVDDSIPLATMNSPPSLNERAIDVRRKSSRRKAKKKDNSGKDSTEKIEEAKEKLHTRNFSEVRVVKILRNESERSLGVTVKAEDGNIVVARIMAGSLADKQGALQVGDVILSVNNCEVYTPEQLQEQLRLTINDETVIMKIVPSYREELPTLCIYLRALFNYDANEDSLLPCKEVGVSFNQGDILEVVNQEDPNWWQARRVDSENLQTGLIPSQELEERRRAFVLPDYDLATRTSICGTKVSRKGKKKEIYNVGQNSDFDKAELQLYEEVCRTPAFERRTLVLIGANGVGKQALKARLLSMDPERFGAPLPHTSRLPREGEEDGIHYHFVTREKIEEDIIAGRYLEYGEYDGALYGTKLDSIREIIGSGKVCVLDCSATCLKLLKTSDYLPFVAFIAAPTLDQLHCMQDWARSGSRTYTTLDRALSRQSRRAKTLQDFAFDFFEDEDLQVTVEESARLFRVYENYFDIVLVNNNFERTFEQLKDAIDALSMAPQWIPISWIYGT